MNAANYLTMTKFCRMGRFANQLLQYAFLRDYADAHSLELQLPPWVGESLFGIQTQPVTVKLPSRTEVYRPDGQPMPPNNAEFVNTDFVGWAQFHTRYLSHYKDIWWNRFRPVESVAERFTNAMSQLRNMGDNIIGLHIRRGDYGESIKYITPVSWYLRWLENHWNDCDNSVLYIASEDRQLIDAFAKYRPVTTESLGVSLRTVPVKHYQYLRLDLHRQDPVQIDFYPDFYFLSHCDVLAIPNSTFSFAAGLCNPCLKRFFRSSLPHAGIVEEEIWNTYPLQHDQVKDYPHLDGIALESNPYW
jgi:hypothetical protein